MDKQWDAILFAINQKAEQAQLNINSNPTISTEEKANYNFDRGQFQAFFEVYTMISNVIKSNQ